MGGDAKAMPAKLVGAAGLVLPRPKMLIIQQTLVSKDLFD
jgi:hypothetical protein